MESEKAPCPNEIGEKARGSRSIQTALGAAEQKPLIGRLQSQLTFGGRSVTRAQTLQTIQTQSDRLLEDNMDEGFCMEFKPDCLSPAPDRGAQKELLWSETICPIFPIRDQEDR